MKCNIVKVYQFIKDKDLNDWTFKEIPNKKFRSQTQPFIADLNGDFLPDILFHDEGEIQIAF